MRETLGKENCQLAKKVEELQEQNECIERRLDDEVKARKAAVHAHEKSFQLLKVDHQAELEEMEVDHRKQLERAAKISTRREDDLKRKHAQYLLDARAFFEQHNQRDITRYEHKIAVLNDQLIQNETKCHNHYKEKIGVSRCVLKLLDSEICCYSS